jgi:hypothetical protein
MDENTIILLIAAGLGLYLWYKNQSASTTSTSGTTPVTGTTPTSSVITPGSLTSTQQAPYPVGIATPAIACSPAYPSMAYALLQAAGGTGATLLTGTQWDALMGSTLLQTGISGLATAAEMAALMTACDYVTLRQKYGALTTVALYQGSNPDSLPVSILGVPTYASPGKVYPL